MRVRSIQGTMNMIVETRLQIQRRLAQNREAARKSRIRKKVWIEILHSIEITKQCNGFLKQIPSQAYIKQLETSRLRLIRLEQELEKARQQVRTIIAPDWFYLPLDLTFHGTLSIFRICLLDLDLIIIRWAYLEPQILVCFLVSQSFFDFALIFDSPMSCQYCIDPSFIIFWWCDNWDLEATGCEIYLRA